MKSASAVLLLLSCMAVAALFPTPVFSATYYFSASSGDDSRSPEQATHQETPWKTLQQCNLLMRTLVPGDEIRFKKDDIFYGFLDVSVSGTSIAPIIFSSYGTGQNPVISGLVYPVNWMPGGNGTWKAVIPAGPAMENTVIMDNNRCAIGRFPDVTDGNAGYLTISNVPAPGTISGATLPASSWQFAEVVIRKTHWVTDRNRITAVNGPDIRYISQSGYNAQNGYGYFLQNDPVTLNHTGEWYYNPDDHTLGIFLGASLPEDHRIAVSNVERLLTITNQAYLVFDGISFEAANGDCIHLESATGITIKNGTVRFAGNTAIFATHCADFTVSQMIIDQSANNACDISFSNGVLINNNIISSTGTVPGSGGGDSGAYEAILLSGDNQSVENNSITSTGYNPITFYGDNISIRQNLIRNFGYVKDDGGGIYAWNNSSNAPVHGNRLIDHNIVLDGTGAPEGTADAVASMHGIYMDDNTDHVRVTGNTIANCSQYGIYLHNAHDLSLDGNTVFNNFIQAAAIHDNIAPQSFLTNISFTNNILFSRLASQLTLRYSSTGNDIGKIGMLDNNYYCRPLEPGRQIGVYTGNGNTIYDIPGWQQYAGQDQHSKPAPVAVLPYRINALYDPNLYQNGNFNGNINNLYVFAAAGNALASWVPTSPLDQGALKISFNPLSGSNNHATIIIGVGKVYAGHQYLLRLDMAGKQDQYVETYLRKSLSPYTDLSGRELRSVAAGKGFLEVLFTATTTDDNASVGLDIPEQPNPVYIDNLRLMEAAVTKTNPDDSLLFLYNASAATKQFPLDGSFVDVLNSTYAGNIELPPFSSIVLIKSTVLLLPVQFLAFTATPKKGKVLIDWTLGDPGTAFVQQPERSADGHNFSKLMVPVNSMGAGRYSSTDGLPGVLNYYRIRYTSAGKTIFSRVIKVDLAQPAPGTAFSIHPNPTRQSITVTIERADLLPCTLLMKNYSGAALLTTIMTTPRKVIDVSHLRRGVYFLTVNCKQQVFSSRFEKL